MAAREAIGGGPPRWRGWLDLPLGVLLLALALGLLEAVRERSFEWALNSDEPEWIAISILHWRQLVEGEPPAGLELQHPDVRADDPWRQGVQATTFGYMNPGLPKLVWGAVLVGAGHREASPLAFQIFHRQDPVAGAAAQRALLPAMPLARRVVIVLAALSAVLLFFTARDGLGGPGSAAAWAAGALAFGLWFASPLVRGTASYLRTDHFMLPFALAALVLVLRARDALGGRRGTRALALAALALGALCGLATSSKLNGALTCFAAALWLPLAWWSTPPARRVPFARGPLLGLAVAGAAAVVVFIALNPVTWSGPVEGAQAMLARWDKLMGFFRSTWGPGTGVEVAHTLPERLSLFARRTLLRDDPLRALTGLPLGAPALVLGLALLAWRCAPRAAGADAAERARILLAGLLVLVAGTALWLPLDWERLYLPATPALAVLEAAAIALPMGACGRWLARRQRFRPAAG